MAEPTVPEDDGIDGIDGTGSLSSSPRAAQALAPRPPPHPFPPLPPPLLPPPRRQPPSRSYEPFETDRLDGYYCSEPFYHQHQHQHQHQQQYPSPLPHYCPSSHSKEDDGDENDPHKLHPPPASSLPASSERRRDEEEPSSYRLFRDSSLFVGLDNNDSRGGSRSSGAHAAGHRLWKDRSWRGSWNLSYSVITAPFFPRVTTLSPEGMEQQQQRQQTRWSSGRVLLSAALCVALASLAIQSVVGRRRGGGTWRRGYRNSPSAAVRVAFVGNSMMYYNDFPRFVTTLSGGRISHQESCLHGDATLSSLLISGNGMYRIWDTGNARVYNNVSTIHDFGACSVPQMLTGYDPDLDARVQEIVQNNYKNNNNNQQQEPELSYTDDFLSFNDGKNPCLLDGNYYTWYQQQLVRMYGAAKDEDGGDDDADDDSASFSLLRPNPPRFDYIILNDNTRGPARVHTRQASLDVLNSTYLSWIVQTGAIPVFMATYGYSTPYRDMGGLGTVPVFTSLTHYGYQLYAESLVPYLPQSQEPRVAPVGIAFLVVWEENFNLWERLFHVDQIHSSPLGTYLQGCVMHHVLFGRLPDPAVALREDMSFLWHDARRFQPGTHRTDLFPTREEATYLYHVAHRVTVLRYIPRSFLHFEHGEAAEYTPHDDLFRVDDLFR